MIDQLARFVQPISRRIRNVVARAVIKAVSEDKALQRLQLTLLAEETLDKIESVGHYGFISSPLPGAEAVAVFLGGERSSGVVIATEDRRYRFKTLANGEVALYTDEGDYIHFKRGRNIEVLAGAKVKVTAPNVEVIASTKVKLTTPLTEISANVTIGGTLAVTGATTMAATLNVSGATTVPALTAAAITAASLAASGAVSSAGTTISDIKSKFNSHKHIAPGAVTITPDVTVS